MSITTIRNNIATALDELGQLTDLQPELDQARRDRDMAQRDSQRATAEASARIHGLAVALQGMFAKGDERERTDAAAALRAAGYVVPGAEPAPVVVPSTVIGIAAELDALEARYRLDEALKRDALLAVSDTYQASRQPYLQALLAFAPVKLGDVVRSTPSRISQRHAIRVDKIRCNGISHGGTYYGPKTPHAVFVAEGWVVRKDGKQGATRDSASLYLPLEAQPAEVSA